MPHVGPSAEGRLCRVMRCDEEAFGVMIAGRGDLRAELPVCQPHFDQVADGATYRIDWEAGPDPVLVIET